MPGLLNPLPDLRELRTPLGKKADFAETLRSSALVLPLGGIYYPEAHITDRIQEEMPS